VKYVVQGLFPNRANTMIRNQTMNLDFLPQRLMYKSTCLYTLYKTLGRHAKILFLAPCLLALSMPRLLTSARPQRLQLSGEEKVQHEFIKALGPYYARAKFENQGPQCLQRFFNIWFARWPLYLQDFEDEDFMRHRCLSIEKVGPLSLYTIYLILCWLGPSPSFILGVFHFN
jgi:hypothetical protein